VASSIQQTGLDPQLWSDLYTSLQSVIVCLECVTWSTLSYVKNSFNHYGELSGTNTQKQLRKICASLANIKATAAVPTLRTLPCPPHAVTELCTLRTNTPTNWLHILIWLVTTDKKRNIRSVRSIDKRRWRGNTHTTVTHLYSSASISLRIFFFCSSSSCFLRASSSSNFCSSSRFLSSSSSRSFSHLALLSSLRCTFLSARRFLRSSSSTFSNSFSFSYAHQYDDNRSVQPSQHTSCNNDTHILYSSLPYVSTKLDCYQHVHINVQKNIRVYIKLCHLSLVV